MFHVKLTELQVRCLYRFQVQGESKESTVVSVNSKRQTTPLPALDTTASTLVGREITWELSCPLARQSLIDKAEAARLSNA